MSNPNLYHFSPKNAYVHTSRHYYHCSLCGYNTAPAACTLCDVCTKQKEEAVAKQTLFEQNILPGIMASLDEAERLRQEAMKTAPKGSTLKDIYHLL